MALISEYFAADLSADASADALGRINISYLRLSVGRDHCMQLNAVIFTISTFDLVPWSA